VLTKTLTVRDEVYKKLFAAKRKGESFSDLFERLVEGIDPMKTLINLRGTVEFKDKEKMMVEIYAARAECRT
jgi:predicted CopG family antitoxin